MSKATPTYPRVRFVFAPGATVSISTASLKSLANAKFKRPGISRRGSSAGANLPRS